MSHLRGVLLAAVSLPLAMEPAQGQSSTQPSEPGAGEPIPVCTEFEGVDEITIDEITIDGEFGSTTFSLNGTACIAGVAALSRRRENLFDGHQDGGNGTVVLPFQAAPVQTEMVSLSLTGTSDCLR